jgi:hypothetical protein
MSYVIVFVILVLVVAIVAAAAYKNNQAKVDQGIADLQAAAKSLKGK